MIDPIVVRVDYTAEDSARSTKYVTMRSPFIRFAWLIPLVIVLGCLAYVAVVTKGSFEPPRYGALASFILALLFVSAMIFFLSRSKYSGSAKRQFQKQIDTSPALQETKTITFDSEGIKGKQGLGAGETSWAGVIEATETTDDFFFFTAQRFAMFVPKRAFTSVEQQEHLRSLLKHLLAERAKNLK